MLPISLYILSCLIYNLFSFKNITIDGQQGLKILTAEHAKLLAMTNNLSSEVDSNVHLEKTRLLIEDKIKQLECNLCLIIL